MDVSLDRAECLVLRGDLVPGDLLHCLFGPVFDISLCLWIRTEREQLTYHPTLPCRLSATSLSRS